MTPQQRAKCLAEIGKLNPPPYEDESFGRWCRETSEALAQEAEIARSGITRSPSPPAPYPSLSSIISALVPPPQGRYGVPTAIRPTARMARRVRAVPVTVLVYVYEFVSTEHSFLLIQTDCNGVGWCLPGQDYSRGDTA